MSRNNSFEFFNVKRKWRDIQMEKRFCIIMEKGQNYCTHFASCFANDKTQIINLNSALSQKQEFKTCKR